MKEARVALVHDWLTGRRGGEKVFEVLAEIFPDAPIFTLFRVPGSQIKELERRKIVTSFLQGMPFLKKKYRSYLPLFPLAAELFNLQEFDLIVSSSHCVVKGIIPHPDALHLCYVHSPVRYAWNQYFPYFAAHKLGPFSKILVPPLSHYLRLWDASSSDRVDHYIANSHNVARRIMKYYRRRSEVIHPPVDTEFFQPGDQKGEYFLIVSALVPYKRIDLAIQAFNSSGISLKIVGSGPEYKKLAKSAGRNIQFLGALGSDELLRVYQNARALIMPGEEDFGITSLEAQACGIPVIAFGRGGAVETVIPGRTGIFFEQLTIKSLQASLDNFTGMEFNRTSVRSNALRFSRERFKEHVQKFILDKWTEHKGGE